MADRPDVIVVLTDEERAAPSYEPETLAEWRHRTLPGRRWFDEHGVSFPRHYTASAACVPSRTSLLTGHFPDLHGATQTDGLGKTADDARMRWLPDGEVPTLGHWFRAAGYDTHYVGKWHVSHADLPDPAAGGPLATNDDDGVVDPAAVQAYLEADRLGPYGFHGWIGPEPHGAAPANSGLVRDPLTADRAVGWLEDRYARRRDGDPGAQQPFLLVVSFVNPHDIVLFPAWVRRSPLTASALDPPQVPPSPTDEEDLSTKPAAQVAYRAAYHTGYGPAPVVSRMYDRNRQRYRDLYYRLHAEVDGHLDRVRRAVTDGGSEDAVIVRTSDHGELLGAHGGLHQKWFNLYDEATRVPFVIARTGTGATRGRSASASPTSHVDLLPTLLSAAGADVDALAAELTRDFTEVHPFPGRDLMGVVELDSDLDPERTVYLQTRDNVLEGDTEASAVARQLGRGERPPAALRIQVPAHVGANLEAIVRRVGEADAPGGAGHLWKLVRTFDDPDTWTEPGVRHLAADGPAGRRYRREPLDEQWELYDLDADPSELENRAADPELGELVAHLVARLSEQRRRSVPVRNHPWPYRRRRPRRHQVVAPRPPARLARSVLQRLGLHPDEAGAGPVADLAGRRAVVVCTNRSVLELGRPTGVFSSEMTAPYYVLRDAGVRVDVASPLGGVIPVDPLSLKPPVRSAYDDRFLADGDLRSAVGDSLAVGDLDVACYDVVYLAGGWGAAFDFATSEELAGLVTAAARAGLAIGGVCHGPLGLVGATGADGRPLVEGRRLTAVTDKQVRELGIGSTPFHPEAELRARGARFESRHRRRDVLANHWVTDGNLVTGQNQNAAPMVARELVRLLAGG